MRRELLARHVPSLGAPAKLAAALVVGLVALAVADLAEVPLVNDLGDNQIAAAVLTEAVLLLAVYLVIEDLITKRANREWELIAATEVHNLRHRVANLQARHDAALEDLSDRARWAAFVESVQWFRVALDRTQHVPRTPRIAALWRDAASLAHEAEWLASCDPSELELRLRDASDRITQAVPRMISSRTRQMLRAADAFAEEVW